jgi:tetratricopeptide (TPR) repeat protein
LTGSAHAHLAGALLQLGRVDDAIASIATAQAARAAAETKLGQLINTVSAQIYLATDRPDDALEHARAALDIAQLDAHIDEVDAETRLVYAQALLGCGLAVEARDAVDDAADRIRTRAAAMPPEVRQSFLERVPWNVHTMQLEAQLAKQPNT